MQCVWRVSVIIHHPSVCDGNNEMVILGITDLAAFDLLKPGAHVESFITAG